MANEKNPVKEERKSWRVIYLSIGKAECQPHSLVCHITVKGIILKTPEATLPVVSKETNWNCIYDELSVLSWYDGSSLVIMSLTFRNKGLVLCSRLEMSFTFNDEATELYRNVGDHLPRISTASTGHMQYVWFQLPVPATCNIHRWTQMEHHEDE
jgi:hypothetical protein